MSPAALMAQFETKEHAARVNLYGLRYSQGRDIFTGTERVDEIVTDTNECEYCGRSFKVNVSNYRDANRRYCGVRCICRAAKRAYRMRQKSRGG